jgi:hypothetical protein
MEFFIVDGIDDSSGSATGTSGKENIRIGIS